MRKKHHHFIIRKFVVFRFCFCFVDIWYLLWLAVLRYKDTHIIIYESISIETICFFHILLDDGNQHHFPLFCIISCTSQFLRKQKHFMLVAVSSFYFSFSLSFAYTHSHTRLLLQCCWQPFNNMHSMVGIDGCRAAVSKFMAYHFNAHDINFRSAIHICIDSKREGRMEGVERKREK